MAITYKDAGVDVTAGYKAVDLMKKYVKETYDSNVVGDIGSFGGFYSIDNEDCNAPLLVAGTDGVGTKLKYAFLMDKHDTIGIDCVAMCVNDIVCSGAKPLMFLDYIALPKLEPEKVASIVKGVATGCKLAGCALIGGETAEMPGFYQENEYDIAGFSVGIVSREAVIDGSKINADDIIIGLASSGLHSNGYSLVRKLFTESPAELDKFFPALNAKLGEVLLTPTKIYVKSILSLIKSVTVKGIAHITGGGFIENIPRMLPQGIGCEININSYIVPPIFKMLQKLGDLSDEQIYNTFNMGVGMVVCVNKNDAEKCITELNNLGERAFVIGKTTKNEGLKLIK